MDFVALDEKRHRGWPAPEDSWGLDPMFGEDGWCHSCGTPLREQCGPLTLRWDGSAVLPGAWVPNWRFDTVCLEASVAERMSERFRLDLRDVAWAGRVERAARQIVFPTVGPAWFDQDVLARKAEERHGVAGASCPECGTWRWMPLTFGSLPQPHPGPAWESFDAIASPEWFGDGFRSFRQILVRRELADLIAQVSPKYFRVQEVV